MAHWHSRVDPPHAAADTIDRINLKSMWLWPLVKPEPRSDRSLQCWSHSITGWCEKPAERDKRIHTFPLGSVESTQPKCPCVELLHVWWRHRSSRAWFSTNQAPGKILPSKANSERNQFNQKSEVDQCYQQRDRWDERCQSISEVSSSLMFG